MPLHLELLQREFERRVAKNARYSLRAYASQLGLHASALSRILKGKASLSVKACEPVLRNLTLSPEEQRLFLCSLIEEKRIQTQQSLSQFLKVGHLGPKPLAISPEVFQDVADLKSLALLQLTFVDDFQADPAWIAERLGMPLTEVTAKIDLLVSVGLLRRDDTTLINNNRHMTAIQTSETSDVRRRHQIEILDSARESLNRDPLSARAHYGMTMAIDPAKLEKANLMVREFMEIATFWNPARALKSISSEYNSFLERIHETHRDSAPLHRIAQFRNRISSGRNQHEWMITANGPTPLRMGLPGRTKRKESQAEISGDSIDSDFFSLNDFKPRKNR